MSNRLVGLVLLMLSGFCAADEKYEFTSEQQRVDFIQLNEELRCPKCQNQNIADSNALIATDMKRKVYELLQQGKSKEEVVQFMKARYGDFVSYNPPMTPLTFFLYFGPLLFITLTLGYLIYNSRTSKKPLMQAQNTQTGDEQEVSQTQSPRDNQSKLEAAEKALKELE